MAQSNRNITQSRSAAGQSGKRGGGANLNAVFVGCIFLGICILIAGINIGSGIRRLNGTIEETNFAPANMLNMPSHMSVADKKYLTEFDAAAYLNISVERVTDLIAGGHINEFVRTDTGYSIHVDKLDEWFSQEAYQNMLKSRGLTED